MKKRLISFLLAAVVAAAPFGTLPVNALAAEETDDRAEDLDISENSAEDESLPEDVILSDEELSSEDESESLSEEELLSEEEILSEEELLPEEELLSEEEPKLHVEEGSESKIPQRDPRPTGYKELPKDTNIYSVNGSASFDASFAAELSSLEPEYITPLLPDLRDQGCYGTCWAFSSMALAEINMMNNGLLPSGFMPEYSKLHLAYFSYNTIEDPLGGTAGDKNGCYTFGGSLLDVGGNLLLSENVLINWVGAADENLMPYEDAYAIDASVVDEGLAYDDMVHLQNYYIQKYDTSNLAPIKQLVKDHGAVGISFYALDPYGGYTSQKVYNFSTNAYYNSSAYGANHAVTIVGWDDNFSRDNFLVTPEGDGAWLIRNSWSTGSLNDSMNFDGYFWLSYYDRSIDEQVNAFEFQQSDNYDNNYQYDGGMDVEDATGQKAANIFTSKAPGGAAGETLKAVGFYTGGGNSTYEVNVYTGITDDYTPDGKRKHSYEGPDLEPAATVSGYCNYAGFFTVELPTPVDLPEGTVFSVVVSLDQYDEDGKSIGYGLFGYECEADYWYTVKTSAEPGQSYLYNDGAWEDFGDIADENLKIKAYTVDNDGSDFENAPTDISFENVPENGTLEIGISDSVHLKPVILPENADNRKLNYTSSNPEVALVSNGVLFGVSEGTAEITATARLAGIDGTPASTTFTVKVIPKIKNVKICGEYSLEIGKTSEFTLNSVPLGIPLEDDIFWFSSNTNVVNIDQSTGTAKGVDVGYAQITALCGDFSDSIEVWVYPQAPPQLEAASDRYNNVTLTWKKSPKASYYKVFRNGRELVRIEASSKNQYKFIDTFYRDDFISKTPIYRVYAYRKNYMTYSEVRAKTFTRVYLESDGGTLSAGYINIIPEEGDGVLPVPVKKGYTFLRWENEYNDTVESYLDIPEWDLSTGEYTLKAIYEPNVYTVNFDKNTDNVYGYMPQMSCVYDTSYSLDEAPFNSYRITTESGSRIYCFTGWNTRPDGSGKTYTNGDTIRNLTDISGGTVTLYAQWEMAKYTVIFDSDGGSYVKSLTAFGGEAIDKPVTDPVKSGYSFAGWHLRDSEEEVTFPLEITGNTTLVAHWTSGVKKIEISDAGNHDKISGTLKAGTEDGEAGFSLDLSARVILKDGTIDNSREIIWKTTDPKVAGFPMNSSSTVVGDSITTKGEASDSVRVCIYSGNHEYEDIYDEFPENGSTAYIYATSADDKAVYASYKITITVGDIFVAEPGEAEEILIVNGSNNSVVYASATGRAGGDGFAALPDVAAGKSLQLKAIHKGADQEGSYIYWSSDNMGVATVSSNGKITGKSPGYAQITARNPASGLYAAVRVKIYEMASDISFATKTYKIGEGNDFTLKISKIVPSDLGEQITYTSSKESVVTLVTTGLDEAGNPTAVFRAASAGKAVITAKAPGGKTSKCTVTVGKPVTKIALKSGARKVAAGKSLKPQAVFNDGAKKYQPLNKNLKWYVTNLDGTATDKAKIDPKTGKLTGLKAGSVKVFAVSTTDKDSNSGEYVRTSDDEGAIVKVYVPLKKAAMKLSSVSLKLGIEYDISLNLTSSVSGEAVTGSFDENGEALDVSSMITWDYGKASDKNYIRIEKTDGATCRIYTLQPTRRPVKVKAVIKPYNQKKKTVSCSVTLSDKKVSKLTLSKSSLSMGRGATKEISAKLGPTYPEETGVIWSIAEEYADDICFVGEAGENLSELSVSTDLLGNGMNKVKIRAKNTAITYSKKVKLTATTVGKNTKGKTIKATCLINLYGDVNYIKLTASGKDVTLDENQPLLQTKKTLQLKATAYYDDGNSLIKSGKQSFNYISSDTSVAKVGKTTGKVTAVRPGTAIITVKTTDGSGVTNSCKVNVYSPVTKVSLDRKGLTVGNIGDSRFNIITPTVSPAGSIDNEFTNSEKGQKYRELTWTFDKSGIIEAYPVDTDTFIGAGDITGRQRILAELDAGGTTFTDGSIKTVTGQSLAVKAVSKGTVNVTVTAPSGKKATCKIKVYAHITGLDVIADFGASPGDQKDDNAAINNAIKQAHENSISGAGETTVYVPAGIYMIKPYDINSGGSEISDGIHMLENVSLVLDDDAVLKVRATDLAEYGVICIRSGKYEYGAGAAINMNVTVDGGKISGERNSHKGSYGEGGHGIYLAGAANVTISNMKICNNWGDGIYIGTRAWFSTSVGCRNITIRNCDIYNNRRNNISIVDMGVDASTGNSADENVKVFTKGLLIDGCNIYSAYGTAPQCGIYVEPNRSGTVSEFRPCLDIYVKNTKITAYQKRDDLEYCCFMTHYDPGDSSYVTARNITFDKCTITGAFGNYSGRNLKLVNGTKINGTKINKAGNAVILP